MKTQTAFFSILVLGGILSYTGLKASDTPDPQRNLFLQKSDYRVGTSQTIFSKDDQIVSTKKMVKQ